MKLAWNTVIDMVAIGFGYSNHQKQLRKALEAQGVTISDDANIAVSIVPAGNFQPVPGKFNVLYTMYESVDIPPSWPEKLDQADLIVVPCSHNKALFKRYTKKPVEVCLEGVDVESFSFLKRGRANGGPFTFLWFGATNERKGWQHTLLAWNLLKSADPKMYEDSRLIMKTTQLTDNARRVIAYKNGKPVFANMPRERMFNADNIYVDTRVLPVKAEGDLPGLVDVYHSAHCFLFPTMGEGFGLTLAEAMSTGCPCIYTDWSGPRDFISSKEGYPLRFTMSTIKAMTPMPDGSMRVDLETKAASASIAHMVHRMRQVYYDYETAVKKGELAAERIRREITWDKSAKSFIELINKYAKEVA